jgi:CheY-like chemotaxis protein
VDPVRVTTGGGRAWNVLVARRSSRKETPLMITTETRPRILVIEQDRVTRETLALLLHYYDFDVTSVPDGAQAISLIANASPDLVVMDWQVPAVSGHALCSALRHRHRELPIVVVTSVDDQGDDEHPVNAWLRKPIDPPLLNQVIRRELVSAH